MPITETTSDPEALTLTVVGEYDVPVERLWQAWSDPRQIERFWGPPEWPATFTRHDMVAGGRSDYFMTGPDGERSSGYWTFEQVDDGRSFTAVDGFATDDGVANDDMPTMTFDVRFEATADGSRFVNVTTFPDLASMEKLVEMGMVEGMTAAMGQMPDVLADLTSFAHGRDTEVQLLTETTARFSRVIRGSVEQVWRAHHDVGLLQRWMLGPDGWTMPVCEPGEQVGDTYRYEWASDDGDERFGFEGEVLESTPPNREVTTEGMIGMGGPSTRNEMTLTPADGATLLTLVITYPSAELREQIMETGMIDGMEASYARLEEALVGASA
ncbi:SRPBCC family protein [Ilumatobacter nonamiensis]|uniref:SRPBCC family protein n=1 Tax=Ilumatobacter nonamiensis TaxID=467093 RepID=UPI000345872E|nr:SRPBCC family protein [Ilumatobacter nonamiensis]